MSSGWGGEHSASLSGTDCFPSENFSFSTQIAGICWEHTLVSTMDHFFSRWGAHRGPHSALTAAYKYSLPRAVFLWFTSPPCAQRIFPTGAKQGRPLGPSALRLPCPRDRSLTVHDVRLKPPLLDLLPKCRFRSISVALDVPSVPGPLVFASVFFSSWPAAIERRHGGLGSWFWSGTLSVVHFSSVDFALGYFLLQNTWWDPE